MCFWTSPWCVRHIFRRSLGCLSINLDISPLDFLFQSPSIPIFSQTTKSFGDTPFQKYQLTLKRQLIGRSAQLEDILSALEHCARTIQHDLSIVKSGIGGDEKTRSVLFSSPLYFFYNVCRSFVNNQLTQAYQPAADILLTNIISIIGKVVSDVTDNQTGSLSLSPPRARLISFS